MLKNVYWMSRVDAMKIQPKSTEALISVSNPDNPAQVNSSWAPSKLLRIGCHDADEDKRHSLGDINHQGIGSIIINCKLFNEQDAREIIKFVRDNKNKVETIYVHCDAGISRSAAIAKFIAGIYNLEFPDHYMLYNKLIYTTLTNTFNKMQYGE